MIPTIFPTLGTTSFSGTIQVKHRPAALMNIQEKATSSDTVRFGTDGKDYATKPDREWALGVAKSHLKTVMEHDAAFNEDDHCKKLLEALNVRHSISAHELMKTNQNPRSKPELSFTDACKRILSAMPLPQTKDEITQLKDHLASIDSGATSIKNTINALVAELEALFIFQTDGFKI